MALERTRALALRGVNAALELANPTPGEDELDAPPPADVAPTIGWRDEPYEGDDVCSPCAGYGVRRRWIRKVAHGRPPGYIDGGLRTCDYCNGTGQKRPSS